MQAPCSRFNQSGFNLVEIMVGLAIGMMATVFMMQIFQSWEERKRTTESGANASISGVMAFYDLQRVIKQAGYGFNNQSLFGCQLTLRTGVTVPLAPLTIIPASDASTALIPPGDPNTDRLLVISGNANSQPQGATIQYKDSTSYIVQMSSAFSINDYVFAAADPCTTASLTRVTGTPADTKVSTAVAPVAGSILVNLGSKPTVLAYAIRNGQLSVCDYMVNNCSASTTSPTWQTLADNIVSLRAQYAVDTDSPPDGVFNQFNQSSLTTACNIAKVGAIRLAVVARSAQFETALDATTGKRSCQVVTAAAPTWDGSAENPVGSGSSVASINLSRLPNNTSSADWQCYRYRVFQSVIPIRNLDWLMTTGC